MPKLAVGKCASCGEPWTDHAGVAVLCKRLEKARGALREIHECVMDPGRSSRVVEIERLCRKTLEETE